MLMDISKEKISSSQFALLVAGFLFGSSLITSFMDDVAKTDAWIVVILAFVSSMPFVLSYVYLAKRFPGKDLIQINDAVYGPYLGKGISFLYLSFFLYLLLLNIRVMGNFYTGFVMAEMPLILIMAVVALACAYAVKKGIEPVARLNMLAVVGSTFVVIVAVLFLLGHMDLKNILPVFTQSPIVYIQSTNIFSAVSYGELIVFLMVYPSLNRIERAGKSTMAGFAIATCLLFAIVVRNTAVLGSAATISANATYGAFRLINIGEFITRVELLAAVGITVSLFIKICVIYHATIAGIGRLFRMRSTASIIIPVGIISAIIGVIVFTSVNVQQWSAENYHPVLAIPFEFILPPLTLLLAKIRGIPAKTGGRST